MRKLRLDPERLTVESFDAGSRPEGARTVRAHDAGCSVQPTCGNPSRGEEGFVEFALTRYACCV